MNEPTIVVAMRDTARATTWRDHLRSLMPEAVVLGSWEGVDPTRVDFAVAWKPGAGAFRAWPNLRGVLSIGAGVDDLVADPTIRSDIAIVRMVDPGLSLGMREYVLLHTLRHHRRQMEIEADQRQKIWRPFDVPTADKRTVGVMGLGALGLDAATHLAAIGFTVVGWKRTAARVGGITTFAGDDALPDFLASCDILVCLLPLTPQTRGVLCAKNFAWMQAGSHLINAGRGECLVEEDLLEALASGQLRAATLDAFQIEPLPASHPFWLHPAVTVTPHTASLTAVATGCHHIATAIGALLHGRRPNGWVDRAAGY